MSDRPKIHVFLGAPPTPDPASRPAAWGEAERRPPGDWRHLELRWQDGHLKAPPDAVGRCLPEQVKKSDEIQKDQGHRKSESDWTTEERHPRQEVQCSASMLEYLDSCFPATPHRSPPTPLSAHTHFLSSWTLSQALVLKGRHAVQSASSPERAPPPQAAYTHTMSPQAPPLQTLPPQIPHSQAPPPQTPTPLSSSTPELFRPLSLSPGASSLELFGPPCRTLRAQEGNMVVEVTPDGVLISQEAEQRDPPSKFPDLKRARISETPPSGLRGGTTLLTRCAPRGGRYSVLVAVVHPSHLKEVKVRSGPSAGSCVPLASIVVTDQSGVEMKVVLWRRAAFWALTVSPGEVLLLTALQVKEDKWRGETVLQSTFSSKLLNLGNIADSASPPVPQQVSACSLSSLCSFLREQRPLLVSLRLRPPQDPTRLSYTALRSLRVNMLVHALLRVTDTHTSTAWRSDAGAGCRSALQLQAVLTVQQPGGQQGALLLWGAAVDWLNRFRDRGTGTPPSEAVWDFRTLLVREGATSDLPELHSTPWSSVRPLDPADPRAQEFLTPAVPPAGLELDLDTLLSQRHSGEVELRVQLLCFHFQDSSPSQNAPQRVDSCTPLPAVVAALSGDVTYAGCARCTAELSTDANGIYCPCYPCLPHTAVRRYYRPGVLTVGGQGSSQVCVQVPPVPLEKILEAPPDRLHRTSAPGSEVRFVDFAAERILTLLSLPRKTFTLTLRSHFQCDENSVALHQDFTLLDLHVPGPP
ncbi:hypothetical protein PBY51_015499 [Eleginops maclovinus]|uniref:Shieldin complex subunit 2 C-terminal domain-containing protein n=1 Tax=Eleginops maclovinus TaxID=56733 RepID=A0AAN7X504_ELEMC|nr:hypothetical protein PBY51_015499 [Eleginops maclovinus]